MVWLLPSGVKLPRKLAKTRKRGHACAKWMMPHSVCPICGKRRRGQKPKKRKK